MSTFHTLIELNGLILYLYIYLLRIRVHCQFVVYNINTSFQYSEVS